jgi:hypothetical protein
MSITQPVRADRARTNSLPQPEIGFENCKFYCQSAPATEQNKGQTAIGFPKTKPILASDARIRLARAIERFGLLHSNDDPPYGDLCVDGRGGASCVEKSCVRAHFAGHQKR